ncbi:MAG: hypothetical protein E7258_04140 [Lachnospiraceae bacterium]|nr:hypothetical protein [Lachnospiraceae bacterium]
MDFNEFVGIVVELIPEYLLQYDVDDIRVEKVHKNNGIVCTGMAICLKGETISPNIYLEYYYNLYSEGKNIDDILGLIRDEYNQAKDRIDKEGYVDMTKEDLKDCVFLKIVNYERNKIVLEECPYISFQDLAITYRYLVKKDSDGIASAIIKNSDLKRWNIKAEDLYEIALENTKKFFPPVLKPLNIMLRELMGDINLSDDAELNVLTNTQGINGATNIIFDDILYNFAKKYDSDIYILPSSIHEVLLLPVSEKAKHKDLIEMVKEINQYVVGEMDYLSDNVYIYSLKEKCIKA